MMADGQGFPEIFVCGLDVLELGTSSSARDSRTPSEHATSKNSHHPDLKRRARPIGMAESRRTFKETSDMSDSRRRSSRRSILN